MPDKSKDLEKSHLIYRISFTLGWDGQWGRVTKCLGIGKLQKLIHILN